MPYLPPSSDRGGKHGKKLVFTRVFKYLQTSEYLFGRGGFWQAGEWNEAVKEKGVCCWDAKGKWKGKWEARVSLAT